MSAAGRSDWSPLDAALARARDEGRTVAVWWRDDDAVAHTPALDRLLALAAQAAAPLALAAIPALVEQSLPDRVDGEPGVSLLVHGLRHANHAPPDRKRAEFGPDRAHAALRADAAEALALARARFGARVESFFVPPWNRIAPTLVPDLPGLGYRGLSAFGDRSADAPTPGLVQVNAHLDPIDWRGSRSLGDPDALVSDLACRIADRLARRASDSEPVGLLTHHLVHDDAVWEFCEALLERLGDRGTRFVAVGGIPCSCY